MEAERNTGGCFSLQELARNIHLLTLTSMWDSVKYMVTPKLPLFYLNQMSERV